MQLDVLTCRKLADAAAVAVRDLADRAQLRRLDEPGRQLDAQHERADLGLVVVQPPPLEAHDVLLGHRLVAGGDQRGQLVADAERRLVPLDALDGVALEDEVPIGLGPLSFRSHGRAHGHLHDGMRLPPLRDTALHDVAAPGGRRRRVLAATTNALALFQARVNSFTRGCSDARAGPCRGRLDRGTGTGTGAGDGLLSTLDILRATWLAGIGTLPSRAGCRGVIGPEPSTSPDVERSSPRPPGSIHRAHGDAPPSTAGRSPGAGRSGRRAASAAGEAA